MGYRIAWILIILFFLILNVRAVSLNGSDFELPPPSYKEPLIEESKVLEKAEQLIIDKVGEEYYKKYFKLENTTYQFNRPTVNYLFNHPTFLEYSEENSEGRGRYVEISFERNGSVRGFRMPKKALNFLISKERAIQIANEKGIKNIKSAKIDYVRQECLPPQDSTNICRPVWIDEYSWIIKGGNGDTIYIDTESGAVIYQEIYPELEELSFLEKIWRTFLNLFR